MSSSFTRLSRPLLRIVARLGVPRVAARIVRRIPHDSTAFTQGLVCHDGILYESTGLYGKSCLQSIDMHSGAVLARHPLPSNQWGEGIALLDDLIVQLTWKSQVAYVYSIPDLKVVGRFSYEGEGWGMSQWNGGLVMSDGSALLTYRNRQFEIVRRLRVCSNRVAIRGLNDLQAVQDRLYINLFYRSEVLETDGASGAVSAIVDCDELVNDAAPKDSDHILNGIAYDREEGLFYLTGKHWPHTYVVEIPKTT